MDGTLWLTVVGDNRLGDFFICIKKARLPTTEVVDNGGQADLGWSAWRLAFCFGGFRVVLCVVVHEKLTTTRADVGAGRDVVFRLYSCGF